MGYGTRFYIGLALIYVSLTVVYMALRRLKWFQPWKPEYGWSLLMPYAALPAILYTSMKRDWTAARNCALMGVAFLCIAECAYAPMFIGYHPGEHEMDIAIRSIHREEGGRPFEYVKHSHAYRRWYTPADRQRVHEAWVETQHEYYTARISNEAPGLSLPETRAKLGYDRLMPSLQVQLDLAWNSHQKALRPPVSSPTP
jgi:hypothetical protein